MSQVPSTSEQEALRRKANYLEVIHEFALSQVGLNSLEDIVWNVAKTAIAKLGFVDCVIYLLDEDGETLVQRAAHGPKNPVEHDIYNPIKIRVGHGIVGSVAQTGRVECIEDTRRDPRYIIDDAMRLSELAVPVIHKDRVIGVLDSEHPEPGFFTEDHVQLLTTIASLASTRIDTAIAMERLHATVSRLKTAEINLEAQAGELRHARNEALRASAEKSAFLANLSHEIRTPMTSIVGYADLLTRSDRSNEEKDEWATQVRRNADHLLGLVNDVLDLSKIEAGELEPVIAPCEFNTLIKDVYELLLPQAKAKGLDFKLDIQGTVPHSIETDNLRLRQILINLASNAVKYTPEGSITFALRCLVGTDAESCRILIDIEDTGIGISASELERVFEPFVRSREARFKSPGTGLGLSISRHFARLLGGEINVISEPGCGSTFSLDIPGGQAGSANLVSPSHFLEFQAGPAAESAAVTRLDGLVVHLNEDSDAIASLVRHLLEERGAFVKRSVNGQEGVEAIISDMAAGCPPDLVLMDMLMPVMDGYQAARTLRTQGLKAPIVAMTAFTLAEDRQKCLDAGCDHYLTKPLNPARFVDQLHSFLH